MSKTCILTNNLAIEFSGSKLIQMFSNVPKSKKINGFNYNIEKYSKKDICEKVLKFLSDTNWSRCYIKFNTIQLLNKYELVKKFYSKDSENFKAYLKLISNNRLYIRNQDQFHYALVSELYSWFMKHSHSEIISDLFYYSDKIVFVNEDKISIENTEKTSDCFFRTDMTFNIRGYKIIVEYLENAHSQHKLLSYEFDRIRALRLLGDTNNQNGKIVHIAFFLENNLYSHDTKHYSFNRKVFFDFVHHIGTTILDYYLISDENSYCINKLTQITGNESLSKQIYLAHNNQNCPVINLETLEKIFIWGKSTNSKIPMKKIWYLEFIDRVKKIQEEILYLKSQKEKNISAFDSIFDSDSDSDQSISENKSQIEKSIQIPDDKIIYYQIINNSVYLTHFGLHVYIDMGPKYLANMYEYFKIRKFYNDITSGLIDAIKSIKSIKENQYAKQIYGI